MASPAEPPATTEPAASPPDTDPAVRTVAVSFRQYAVAGVVDPERHNREVDQEQADSVWSPTDPASSASARSLTGPGFGAVMLPERRRISADADRGARPAARHRRLTTTHQTNLI
jgi:hypothetical protein